MSHIDPVLPAVLLLLIGGVLLARWLPKIARGFLLAGVVALFLASWPPSVWLAMRAMESGYDRSEALPFDAAQAIVVVSSGVYSPEPPKPKLIAGAATYARVVHAAWLAEQWPTLPIVASGGLEQHGPGSAHADVMAEILIRHGLARDRIVRERRSRNTHENAIETQELLGERGIVRIVLVTDAVHMRRAELSFLAAGFEVQPSPIGFEPTPSFDQLATWVPSADGLRKTDAIVHEVVGLVYYWFQGWI